MRTLAFLNGCMMLTAAPFAVTGAAALICLLIAASSFTAFLIALRT